MVGQNPPPSQRLPPTMVRSMVTQNSGQRPTMVQTTRLTNLRAASGSKSNMLPYNFQHQELNNNTTINNNNNNNNNKNKVKETNKKYWRSKTERNGVQLPPPFSFHYTLEASGDQRLDLELRATCQRYKEVTRFNNCQTNQQRSSRVNHHQNPQNKIQPSNNFQQSLPNQIALEENKCQQTVMQNSNQKKIVPINQQRKGSSDHQAKMPSQAKWERSDRFLMPCTTKPNHQHEATSFKTKPNHQPMATSYDNKPNQQQRITRGAKFQTNFEESSQPRNYHHLLMPNQTSWEEEISGRARPPRRLPTISEVPQSRLPRLNLSSLNSKNTKNLNNSKNCQNSENSWTGKEQLKQKRTGRESDVEKAPSKVETWRQMFLERHYYPHRGHHDLGLETHPHAPHHPQDAPESHTNQTSCGPLNPSAFNAGYDERKRKVRVRFADSGEEKLGGGGEEDGRSRMIGFSRGLQDGLRRKIERMVRKPTSPDTNYRKCREGCDEISNTDSGATDNCDGERNYEEVNFDGGAKRRRAWPTPCRLNKAKVTIPSWQYQLDDNGNNGNGSDGNGNTNWNARKFDLVVLTQYKICIE